MENDHKHRPNVQAPPAAAKPIPELSAGPAAAAAAARSSVLEPGLTPARPDTDARHKPPSPSNLSTVELVRQITSDMRLLVQKEIELGKAELKADLKAEAITVGGLSLAAIVGLCTLNMLLVTVVLALALVLPGWGAGLIVSGATLLIAGAISVLAWRKRVRSPLARTRRTLKEDVQWTRERLV